MSFSARMFLKSLSLGKDLPRAIAAAALLALLCASSVRAEEKPEFARPTIDLGMVVSDVGRSVKFYTEAIGFKEVPGFGVPGDFAGEAGLTYNKPLDVHVLVLGEGDGATKLKLMQIKDTESKKSDNEYIHSQLGYRYMTIFVSDTNAAVARLKKAGAKTVAKHPVPLPKGLTEGVFLTVVRDPDGNLLELVGPKETKPRKPRAKAEKEKADK
jgi:catechol 2,3-dioxygenase-like lactoylglutathione lyase family enzyme